MEPALAQIIMFGGNFAPRSWALCHGQLLPINSNQALFSLLGTIYGGDGRTTFALPDLRGRVPIGPGRGPGLSDRREGAKSGAETVTLSTAQIPGHNHTLAGTSSLAGQVTLGVNEDGQDATDPSSGTFTEVNIYSSGAPDGAYSHVSTNLTAGGTTGNTGGSRDHYNMQPWLAVNYIICTQGIFPSRS